MLDALGILIDVACKLVKELGVDLPARDDSLVVELSLRKELVHLLPLVEHLVCSDQSRMEAHPLAQVLDCPWISDVAASLRKASPCLHIRSTGCGKLVVDLVPLVARVS